jgi:phospholipid/cholesterol/gamma-HCH transport system ATP-binding protein
VIVTHEMDSAFKIATRMAMLYEGKIIAQDTPERFRENQNAVVAQFVTGDTEGPMSDGTTSSACMPGTAGGEHTGEAAS